MNWVIVIAILVPCSAALAVVKDNSSLPVMLQLHEYSHEDKLQSMMDRAQLGNHGFTGEVVTKVVTTPGALTTSEKVYHFYKVIPCRRVPEVEEQLKALFPGVFDPKSFKEFIDKKISTPQALTRMCKVGLEMQHFPAPSTRLRKRSASCTWVCVGCQRCRKKCNIFYCTEEVCEDGYCCACV